MPVVVGLLALINLFVLHVRPFGGTAPDITLSLTAASVCFVYVIAIMLPARGGRSQTMTEGVTTGFLISGSMTQVIFSTYGVWLAKLPHMTAMASVGAVMVVIGCCMSLFVVRRRP